MSKHLDIGTLIKFAHFGVVKRGAIHSVGKYGYWIRDTMGCYGAGYARCPFDKAVVIKDE